MKKLYTAFWITACSLASLPGHTQSQWQNDFSNQGEILKTVGRGECSIADGVFRSKGSYACFGNPEWKNYSMSFKARAPKGAEQVQIWAGFRAYNRFDRYVAGIKGGLQDDVYLMRTGYMGTDEFMGVRPLGFHPVPGEWYSMKVEVCGNRIRVFVNGEKEPYIDVVDKNANLVPSGEVTLGGGWIETEFDDLIVTLLPDNYLKNVKAAEYRMAATSQQKEAKRRRERANYKAVMVNDIKPDRTEISLDGDWLFMPEYQLDDKAKAVSATTDDEDWHVMQVPNFWNPIRIWLHGETMPTPNGPNPKGVSDTYYQQETDRCEGYTFDYRKTGTAWYRQWLELPTDIKGKQLTLSFDAVSKMAEVYVNGQLAGSNVGMFGDFQVDATDFLHPGRNVVVVKVTRDISGAAAQTSDAMENYYSSVRKDGFLYLNGRKFWMRGGNHIPFAICPNDSILADKFMQLMKAGNVQSTRTHTTPWNELWVSAADRNGIAISFEGTWSWLMIHSTPIPDKNVLDLWSSEWLRVMKKYWNHPSVFFWTVNNEMKFYDLDADMERSKEKFRIVSDVVKGMRELDPTRPVCFDSNYLHSKALRRFGQDFLNTVDDGDIDDNHAYYNWYDFSLFRFFNGEFQKQFKSPGRPLISQEMSTGYPNAETGHPTRSYQLIHQNPYSLIGYEAYDWADPMHFLKVQSFITGELAETLRRTNEQVSGIMHFAYMTWFRQCYNYKNIQPYPTYYAMQRAMQPVLVSAELWGRNLYAGEKLHTRIYVVNDSEDGRDLLPMALNWSIVDEKGKILASGTEQFPAVEYYGRKYIEPAIVMPSVLPSDKMNVKLKLVLVENGQTLSQNEYDLILANKRWNIAKVSENKKIVLLDKDNTSAVLDFLQVKYQKASSVKELVQIKRKADLCIISGLKECTDDEKTLLRTYQQKGGKLLLLNSKEIAKKVYPEHITGWIIPTEGDIVVMERDDAPVFDGIGVLDLRYFNNNKREIPLACHATLKANRNENVTELAGQMKIHAYIDGGKPEDRIQKIESMRGLTLLQIKDGKGTATVSTLCTEKADTDPIAGKLLVNMINTLVND
nr:glycoside hydrolase family 2 TIM barrel-domain containing protein [Bacteroides intestinalis]